MFLFLIFSCAKKGIELRFNHQPGQTAQYQLSSEVKTRTSTGTASKSFTIGMNMVVNYRVVRIIDKGDAEILFTYDKIRYLNTENPAQSDSIIKQLTDLKIYITLSPYGEITSVKGYENIPKVYIEDFNIFTLLMKALPIFPRAPIQIGKQWEREQEFPIENGLIKGNMLVFKRFSLLDTSSVDGALLAKIRTELNMKFDVPKTDNFYLEQDGNERLGLFGTGTISFDATQGAAVSASAAMFGKIIVNLKHPINQTNIKTRIEIAQNISMKKL